MGHDGYLGGHAHEHTRGSGRTRIAAALAVVCVILAAEVVGAALTGSLTLLVDAAHLLTDAVGLVVALAAATLALRPADTRRTWGWARAEVLAAGAQASILLLAGAFAVVEAGLRLLDPPAVAPGPMAVVGAVGLVGNGLALAILAGGRHDGLNLRAAFLEVAADALGALAVLVAAGVIALTGWVRADAVAGIAVAGLVVPRAVILLRESGSILLESTPAGLDLDAVRAHVLELPHVRDVHDLHASAVATNLPVLTAHVVLDDACFTDGHSLELLVALQECVYSHHGVSVEHSTFQLESVTHAAREHLRH